MSKGGGAKININKNPYFDESIRSKQVGDTQKKIQKQVLELYREKNFEDISIKEVCSKLGIARTTFYYYYGNIQEVLDELENTFLACLFDMAWNLYDLYRTDEKYFLATISKSTKYMYDNREFLKILLVERDDAKFVDKWTRNIMFNFYDLCRDNKLKLMLIASTYLTTYKYYLINDVPFEEIKPRKIFEQITNIINIM